MISKLKYHLSKIIKPETKPHWYPDIYPDNLASVNGYPDSKVSVLSIPNDEFVLLNILPFFQVQNQIYTNIGLRTLSLSLCS